MSLKPAAESEGTCHYLTNCRWLREATVVVPWIFSYITLALTLSLTLSQKLKRHTVAPRGSRIHYENAL